MTQEEKRIKIAELCGWTKHYPDDEVSCYEWVWVSPAGVHAVEYDKSTHLPDYFNDLNACHEAEKTLTELEFGNYHDILLNQIMSVKFISAEAAQRAEAFGRVKGLWKE